MNDEVLILDMDNTLADLYIRKNFLNILETATPQDCYNLFYNLDMLISEQDLKNFCSRYKHVIVISMAPCKQTAEHDMAVVRAKVNWVHKNYPFISNIIITKRIDNKNLLNPENNLYVELTDEFLFDWKPRTKDVLCDDSPLLRSTFVGQTILPQWKIREFNG